LEETSNVRGAGIDIRAALTFVAGAGRWGSPAGRALVRVAVVAGSTATGSVRGAALGVSIASSGPV
jgi:hypothetical protein